MHTFWLNFWDLVKPNPKLCRIASKAFFVIGQVTNLSQLIIHSALTSCPRSLKSFESFFLTTWAAVSLLYHVQRMLVSAFNEYRLVAIGYILLI